MPRKTILWIIVTALLAVQCKQEQDSFLIQKGQIGKLLRETTIKELDSVYASDSLVKRVGEGDYVYTNKDQYLIYEKGGTHLLTLTPAQQHDSTETIAHIQIMDARYKTVEGISINSTFKDIEERYTITKMSTTFNNILIFTDEIDAYFTIDKKDLPPALQQLGSEIKMSQIPGKTKIKYFMVGWE